MSSAGFSRRNALAGAATVGLGLPVLAACGGGGTDTATGPTKPAGSALAAAADIPVGGGKIFADAKVVVTQPTAGEFKGFTSICTHQGCPVTSVEGGTINCPCHGSKFSIEDGSVEGGPAPAPLPAVKLAVKGGRITLA